MARADVSDVVALPVQLRPFRGVGDEIADAPVFLRNTEVSVALSTGAETAGLLPRK